MRKDVKDWLERHHLSEYADAFAENEISFDALFTLEEQDLKDDLGLSLGARKRFLKAVAGSSSRSAPNQPEQIDRAERRQLTIMFCDLVDSTSLSTRFDPEDLRRIISQFQNCCKRVVQQFGGTVARYMDDGLLVYFGFPTANEHDPENAVRAAKNVTIEVTRLSLESELRLQARIGIATGAVVVGDLVGRGSAREQSVVGRTPVLAKRLQGLADPGDVVVAEVTRNLVGDIFRFSDLGTHTMKGFEAPEPAWRVDDEIAIDSRFEALHPRADLLNLVGRENEVEQLMRLWARTDRGEGQAALLLGEAGIGKSRLIMDVRDRLTGVPHTVLYYSCSPFYQDSALYPVIDNLERAAGFDRNDGADTKLDKLEVMLAAHFDDVPTTAPLYASLLSISAENRYPPLALGPQLQQEKTFTALQAQLASIAAKHPVLLIFEDLHWIDPTTLELVERTINQISSHAILMLLAARPSFESRLSDLKSGTIRLNRLGVESAAEIVAGVTGGRSLPRELEREIIERADGIPLFVEELTKTVIESNQLRESNGRFEPSGPKLELAVPETLRDSLTARLDRLGKAKEIAQIAAVVGRQFSFELLTIIAPFSRTELSNALGNLVESNLVNSAGVPPDSTYTFKHALIQDAAYANLLLEERARLHRAIADALEEHGDEQNARPELIAYHYTRAGERRKAITYWLLAGNQARDRAAHSEAVQHLETALEILKDLPDSEERLRIELKLRVPFGINLEASGGYTDPRVAENYARASELCEELELTTERVPVLLGHYVFRLVRADHELALTAAQQCVQLSELSGRADYLMDACAALGMVLPYVGRLEESLPVLNRCIDLGRAHAEESFEPITAQDPEIASLCQLGVVQWLMGCPDQAILQVEKALDVADNIGEPINVAMICPFASEIFQLRHDWAKAFEYAEMGMEISAKHGYTYWLLINMAHLGIIKGNSGQLEDGSKVFQDALGGLQAGEAHGGSSYFFAGMADVMLKAGEIDRAMQLVSEGLEMADRTHEHHFLALLYQLRGQIGLKTAERNEEATKSDLQHAIEIAQHQRARGLELRASTDIHSLLVDLDPDSDETRESRVALESVYRSFSEGFDTGDMLAAKTLLELNFK